MLFNDHRLLGQLHHFFIIDGESHALFFGDIFNFHLLAVRCIIRVHHLDQLAADVTTNNGLVTGSQGCLCT